MAYTTLVVKKDLAFVMIKRQHKIVKAEIWLREFIDTTRSMHIGEHWTPPLAIRNIMSTVIMLQGRHEEAMSWVSEDELREAEQLSDPEDCVTLRVEYEVVIEGMD